MDQEEREVLGREVRNVWVEFAREQADPKPGHLIGWDELDEANKEVDRRIGERIAKLTMQQHSEVLNRIVAGIDQLIGGVEVGFSFSREGVIINRKNTLEVLQDMARALQESVNLLDEEVEP